MNLRPARVIHCNLCLQEKTHIHKIETKETPEKSKALGITTQDLQEDGVHVALNSLQMNSVHPSHKLSEAHEMLVGSSTFHIWILLVGD